MREGGGREEGGRREGGEGVGREGGREGSQWKLKEQKNTCDYLRASLGVTMMQFAVVSMATA